MLPETEVQWYQLRRFQRNILAESTFVADRLQHAHAKRHLKEGFNTRLLMMDVSAREMRRITQESGRRPLPPYSTAQLTLYLNAFYLNLRGAMDNLAWALAYEFNLMPDLNEEKPKYRAFCNLFHKGFQEKLKGKFPALVVILQGFEDWFSDLRTLRDPAAHRIPLCFPSSVMSTNEGEQWRILQDESVALSRKASKAIEEENLEIAEKLVDEMTDLQYQAAGLGRFVPVIITSEASGHKNRSAPHQLEQDEANFLKIAHVVVVHCLKNASQ